MRWFERILVIVALLAVLAGVATLGFMGILLYSFSQMGGVGFMIPPQDCILLERDINGRVQDKHGQPIKANLKIQAGFSIGFEPGKVDLNLTTDQAGRFSANDIDIFACDSVSFEISATGYATKKIEFIAAQEYDSRVGDQYYYGDPDYKTALTNGSTPVMPRQIIIELP